MSAPVGEEGNIPRPFRSFLFLAPTHCLPPSLFIVSIQYTYSFSPCGMRFIPVCRFFSCLPPLACSNQSCSIFSMPADSCSCAFAYLCRHCLLCPVRHCLYCHTLHLPHFYFAKVGQASCCKGHIPCLPRQKFQRFWGAVAPLSKFSASVGLKFLSGISCIYIPSPCFLLYCT